MIADDNFVVTFGIPILFLNSQNYILEVLSMLFANIC
jgi:hypothetical protein